MSGPCSAVSLPFEFDTFMRPMRPLKTAIGQAHQEVEKLKEGWLGEILHDARSFE
jgi:hypothetical protein